MEEIWKDIEGYEGIYQVSNLGRVRTLDKEKIDSMGRKRCFKGRILKSYLNKYGYLTVTLYKNNKPKTWLIHRLVYSVFSEIDILPKEKVVDHIDGNKLNNSYKNLRLTTLSENVNSALYNTKTNSSCKKVEQLTLTDEHIKYFDSVAHAARELKLDSSTISKVCRGVNKSHGGFHFRYIE